MLIRIAPDMFCDERYECVTIQEMIQEIFRTQKFKTRYPWRTKYKSKIKALEKSKVESADFKLYLEAIQNIIVTSKINERTKSFFSLSYVDQKIAACSIAHGFKLTTVDDDLNDFVTQEFAGETISPLEIVNDWIIKGLTKWNDDHQSIIEDWDKCNEHPQPEKEVKRFEKLTGFKYCGP
ncbi:MAG: hypothetical protein U9R17_15630 [Thermodesulfobacteriota bacterium]|nr:hypothetical protein [Thermodesulfobacteriota bacterium]